MKITSLVLSIIFVSINLSANEKWISIEPENKTQTPKANTKLGVNISQIEPINKMMKNAIIIKQLIDSTSKKEEPTTNNKNWFVLNNTENK